MQPVSVSEEGRELLQLRGASKAGDRAEICFLGIDPGLGGALAAVCGPRAAVWDTPAAQVRKGRDYLVGALVARLAATLAGGLGAPGSALCALPRAPRPALCAGLVAAALEQGIAMPRQSSASTYKTGRGVGLWEGALAALGVSYEFVAPRTWKRDIGLPVGAGKGESRALAARLFPALGPELVRVKDDGRAEALLLAEWRRRRG